MRKWPRRVLSIIAAAGLVVFVVYQIYNANFSAVQTETVLMKTAEEKLQVKGVAIREERLLQNTAGGMLQYALDDGSRVDKNGVVARVYQNAQDASNLEQKQALEKELEALRGVSLQGARAGADTLDERIAVQLRVLQGQMRGRGSDYTDARRDLMVLLNEKDLLDGNEKSYQSRISTLQGQIQQLSGSSAGGQLGQVTAPAAGYFSRKTDGLETGYDFSKATALTVAQLKQKPQPKAVPQNTVGRVCTQFSWYFAFVASPKQAPRLQKDASVQITFPFARSEAVQATVSAVNKDDKSGEAAVILRCGVLDASLIDMREEDAQVTLHSYQGLQVSQRAIHFAQAQRTVERNGKKVKETKQVQGVYVLRGGALQFRQVVPLYSDGKYVYCNPKPDAALLYTDTTVQRYDEIVTEGRNLYDGKHID